MFPQQGPCGESCSISIANGLFILSYLPESPVKELSHKRGGETYDHRRRSPMWIEGLYTVGCGLVPRGSFMTLLFLPQCHAAFSMIPSALAWVEKSPDRQCVLQ